jgi:hypothetical protein
MSKGGSVGSQGTTQQARGSFSGNSRPSYGGNQAGGLGSKGGSQSYQEPYRSPYGQGPSYSQHGMRSGFGGFMENPQAMPTQNTNFSQTDSNGNFTSTPSGGQMMMFQPPRRQEASAVERTGHHPVTGMPIVLSDEQPQIRTQGPESLIGQGPSGTYQQFGDFSVGVEGPSITYGTPKPNFDRQSQDMTGFGLQEQYMPVPLGQPFQIATNDMPSPSFAQPQQFSGGFGSKGGLMNQTGRGYRSGIGGFF